MEELDSPADFASTELRNFDQALRCPICQEFLIAPTMISACLHSFCSKCVRDNMQIQVARGDRPTCPQCHKDADVGLLRRTNKVDEVVLAWKEARATILKLQSIALQSASTSARGASTSASTSGARKGKGKARASTTAALDGDLSSSGDESNGASSRAYATRSRTQTQDTGAATKSKASGSTAKGKGRARVKAEPIEDDINDGDSSDVVIVDDPVPKKRRKTSKPDAFGQCPLCQKDFPTTQLEVHAASCGTNSKAAWGRLLPSTSTTGDKSKAKGKGKGKPGAKSTSPVVEPEEKPLILRDYVKIKAKELENLLIDHNLPTSFDVDVGQLPTWKRRHGHWTTLWNANLDLAPDDVNRKTPAELRKELKDWERRVDVKPEIKTKAAYMKEGASAFRKLEKDANARKAAKKAEREAEAAAAAILAPDSDTDVASRLVAPTPPPPAPPLPASGDLSPTSEGSSSTPSSPQLPTTTHFSSLVPSLGRKRERSESPFDPEGPKPSQRVREEIWIEEEGTEESGTDGTGGLGALAEEDEDDDEMSD
ncbi:hypothetical protein RQP46_009651 [Phenoliferia psychrophenolica]